MRRHQTWSRSRIISLVVVVAVVLIAGVLVISRDGGPCDYPMQDPEAALDLGNQRLSPGESLAGFVLRSEGGHAIEPANVDSTTVSDGSVYANGGDNIKLGDNSHYESLYLAMSESGRHLDAMQGQGATGVTVRNVTIRMTNHRGVTGAILLQTRLGGGGDRHRDITFSLDCIRLIGTGPFGHDIRVDYKNGAGVTGRITNIDMEGTIQITDRGGGGTCRVEVDTTALPHVSTNDCTVIEI